MILVDPRIGSRELLSTIRQHGVKAELSSLTYGDACFDGFGPKGPVTIGIERKRLHDMLHCIDDKRYSAHQLPGMYQMYDRSILIVEGHWRPHDQQDLLMEGFNGGISWGPCRYRTQRVLYSKLRRYLMSVAMSGVIVTYSRDLEHTAIDVCEYFRWFQKRWTDHTALIDTQRLVIPSLTLKPTLVRRWASEIDDIGIKYGIEAEKRFKRPVVLANADESEWCQIPGVGPKTAIKVVKQIQGWDR
jgi:ERCC4-type nuclease